MHKARLTSLKLKKKKKAPRQMLTDKNTDKKLNITTAGDISFRHTHTHRLLQLQGKAASLRSRPTTRPTQPSPERRHRQGQMYSRTNSSYALQSILSSQFSHCRRKTGLLPQVRRDLLCLPSWFPRRRRRRRRRGLVSWNLVVFVHKQAVFVQTCCAPGCPCY